MKILTLIDDQIIVQFSKNEFELLKQRLQDTADYRLSDSVEHTMNQVLKKPQNELAFEAYRGIFVSD